MQGKILLIPTTLGNSTPNTIVPAEVQFITRNLKHYIVENERSARRYLKMVDKSVIIEEITFYLMDKHTKDDEFIRYFAPIFAGFDVGVMSEAGCPGIADPGAEVVRIAHEKDIQVIPYVGPSSILLSLIASGMNGQNFAFNGYLPISPSERTQAIKNLESRSKRENQTQIFIETPFRNDKFFEELIKTCMPSTRVCVAADITLDSEYIKTKTAAEWRKKLPQINKRPAIFLIQA